MIERVDEVLKVLEAAKLTCNPKKCKFRATCFEFLGFEIRCGSLHSSSQKAQDSRIVGKAITRIRLSLIRPDITGYVLFIRSSVDTYILFLFLSF